MKTPPNQEQSLPDRCDPQLRFNWGKHLSQHDLVWESFPRQWNEGGFTGNGLLGTMVYGEVKNNRIIFHIGRADVTDHRGAPESKTAMGVKGSQLSFDYPRLDIGKFVLYPGGAMREGRLRLHLWDAAVCGSWETDRGSIGFELVSLRDPMVQRIAVWSTETDDHSQPQPFRWQWLPGNADAPRAQIKGENITEPPKNYTSNPQPLLREVQGYSLCEQPLQAGGDYTTAWIEEKATPSRPALLFPEKISSTISDSSENMGHSSVLWISTANEIPDDHKSAQVAIKSIQSAQKIEVSALRKAHQKWWHNYFRRSFLSLPDARIESYWWIQMYKIGAGVRREGPALDLHGPWFRVNQWAGLWWNLNVQQTYWPFLPANRIDLGKTLLDLIDQHFDTLLKGGWTQGAKDTFGDMAWALHNYWLHLQYDGDLPRLQKQWLPKAICILETYESLLERGDDGLYHLQPMNSPEFNWRAVYPDTNYNLALLRWFLREVGRAIDSSESPHPRRKQWKEIEQNLVPPPCDEYGLMIGTGQSVDHSHRHFSHLLGLYPLFVFDADETETRRLLDRTIEHWLTVEHPERRKDMCQFSLAAASSLFAVLGEGDKALGQLRNFLDNRILEWDTVYASQHLPNTFSVETKGRNPTMEAPMAAANATMELLLQSWGGKIRIFPALPSDWEEACFHDLRAQGGFSVSAAFRDGTTSWVYIHSLLGNPIRVEVKGWSRRPKHPKVQETPENSAFILNLQKGESIVLFHPEQSPNEAPEILPIKHDTRNIHPFGVKTGQHLAELQYWDTWQ